MKLVVNNFCCDLFVKLMWFVAIKNMIVKVDAHNTKELFRASKLQTLCRSYKAVVVSAYGDMTSIRKAMNRGASDFIMKPIDFTDFEIT